MSSRLVRFVVLVGASVLPVGAAAGPPADLAPRPRSGIVESIDPAAGAILLRGGEMVRVGPGTSLSRGANRCALQDLRPGDRVRFVVPPPQAIFVRADGPAGPPAAGASDPEIERIVNTPDGAPPAERSPAPPPDRNPPPPARVPAPADDRDDSEAGILSEAQAALARPVDPAILAAHARVARLLPAETRGRLQDALGEYFRLSLAPPGADDPVRMAREVTARRFPAERDADRFRAIGVFFLGEALKAENQDVHVLQAHLAACRTRRREILAVRAALEARAAALGVPAPGASPAVPGSPAPAAAAPSRTPRLGFEIPALPGIPLAAGAAQALPAEALGPAAASLGAGLDGLSRASDAATRQLRLLLDRRARYLRTLAGVAGPLGRMPDGAIREIR